MQDTRIPLHPLIIAALWGVLPSISFIGFYYLGLDNRVFIFSIYTVIAILLCSRASILVLIVFWLLVLADIFMIIATIFGFSVFDFLLAVKFIQYMTPVENTVLFGMITFVLVNSVILTILGVRYRPSHRVTAIISVFIVGFIVPGIAFQLYQSLQSPPVYAPETRLAATKQTDFGNTLTGENRKSILIMVESLGTYARQDIWATVTAPLSSAGLGPAFTVTHGDVQYSGHTTDGEIREFCHQTMTYVTLMEQKGLPTGTCIPDQMTQRGYTVTAFHAFTGEFFERTRWYPMIGLHNASFRKDLPYGRDTYCAGPFLGACDITLLDGSVKPLLQTGGDQFIYFLTLSSHIPFIDFEKNTPFDCRAENPRIADYQVCQQSNYFHLLFQAVADMLTEASGGNYEILIVGDHAAPFIKRNAREEFKPGLVPWVHIISSPDSAPE